MYEEEEDRISDLQDCLLIDIISRLASTKETVRTGALSKRWQHLWPYVHNLIFTQSNYPLDKFVSLVDKTLTQCSQSNLHKFQIITSYDVQFESQFNNWIRYAVSRNVQDFGLSLWITDMLPEFVLDQFIFVNSCFTHLRLDGCVLNPTGAISWSKLTSLSISQAELSEDLIQNMLSGCPLLETLELAECYGYQLIDITSKSVKNFVFSGYITPEEPLEDLDDIIEINAPDIVSLTITGHLLLWKLLLLNVSSLVKAELNYIKMGHDVTTRKEGKEEMLKAFIQSLRHVTELKIGSCCVSILSRLEAKGFIFPSNLKVVGDVSLISSDSDSDSVELVHWSDRDSNESGDSDGDSEELLLADGSDQWAFSPMVRASNLVSIDRGSNLSIGLKAFNWYHPPTANAQIDWSTRGLLEKMARVQSPTS